MFILSYSSRCYSSLLAIGVTSEEWLDQLILRRRIWSEESMPGTFDAKSIHVESCLIDHDELAAKTREGF